MASFQPTVHVSVVSAVYCSLLALNSRFRSCKTEKSWLKTTPTGILHNRVEPFHFTSQLIGSCVRWPCLEGKWPRTEPVRCSEKGKCSWKLPHVCTLNVSQAVGLIFDSSSAMDCYSRTLVKSDRNLMQWLTVGSPGSYLMLTFRTYFYAAGA